MDSLAPKLSPSQQEILIVAPTGQDATLLANALRRESMFAEIYPDLERACARLREEAGVILVAEEALTESGISALRELLGRQEPWSDIPVVVMTGGGAPTLTSLRILKAFASSGSVTLLERPFRSITLISTLQVALRARRRQYQVRELLEMALQATRLRDEFISIASHELKTPLTSLKLQTQLNKRHQAKDPAAFSEKVTRLIHVTDTQVDRLTRLVEDMLDISRISTGKLVMQKSEFDLADLAREVVDRFMPQLKSAGCDAEVRAPAPVPGRWDRYRLEQVLNNLITNAIRYAPGKPIEIEVLLDGPRARLTVADRGKGIDPANRERIFQRFERAVDSGNISGLGLGLYICRQIVETHGGTIRVESELGLGSRFVVEVPVAAESAGEPPLASAASGSGG
jgi:signal transduction histidine kinase